MPSSDNNLVIMNLPDSRTPSPYREIRGLKLFRAISKRLSMRRSNEDLEYQEDSNSSSSDSSSTFGRNSRRKEASADSGFRSVSPNQMSSSSSEAGSDIQSRSRHHHSTSAESIRKVFQNLSLNVRSQSCSNTKEKRKTKKPAMKILRQPVSYTYVKGLSGLPTQRIPRNSKMFQSCGCSMYYTPGR